MHCSAHFAPEASTRRMIVALPAFYNRTSSCCQPSPAPSCFLSYMLHVCAMVWTLMSLVCADWNFCIWIGIWDPSLDIGSCVLNGIFCNPCRQWLLSGNSNEKLCKNNSLWDFFFGLFFPSPALVNLCCKPSHAASLWATLYSFPQTSLPALGDRYLC